MPADVTVLRLGHRPQRDKRMTTHVCLTARAFGAQRIILTTTDDKVAHTVQDVTDRFGGPFELTVDASWRRVIESFDGPSVHLTMYGQRHTEVLPHLQDAGKVLIVVGAEKVPGDVYDLVTYNVAVGNQPHSEVAALATVLAGIQGSEALYRAREGARLEIEPTARGKRMVDRG